MNYEEPLLPSERAERFLRAFFARRPHGAWKREIMAEAKELGIGERTIARVAKMIGVRSRSGGRLGAIWVLDAPESEEPR